MPNSNGLKIRDSIVEGIFYPAEKSDLEARVRELLEGAETPPDDAFALISPHASYDFSGRHIAEAFRASSTREIDTVVLLAPVHREKGEYIVLPESDRFSTPMGSITVDQDRVDELLSCSTGITRNDIPHLEEHSIEVQLPFIQLLFPEASIIPILIGEPKPKSVTALSQGLQLIFQNEMEKTLFVASSNMSYAKTREKSDQETERLLDLIYSLEWKNIIDASQKGDLSTCGAGGIATLLSFKGIEYRPELLSRGSSKDLDPRSLNAVNYAAVALHNDKVKTDGSRT